MSLCAKKRFASAEARREEGLTWPLGKVDRFADLRAGTRVVIEEGTGEAAARLR
jgi:hypothetical protein